MNARLIVTAIAIVTPTYVHAADPDALGSHEVVRSSYDLGDTAFVPATIPEAVTEIRAVIHGPVDLENGPYPVVVIMHGRHPSCLTPSTFDPDDPWANTNYAWPCTGEDEALPSFEGYEYWAENLASHGYVVVSIGANGIAGYDNTVADFGAGARAELIETHLDILDAYNTTDEYGTAWNGAFDLQNIGLVGHSRAGDGVAEYVDSYGDSAYRVNAVLMLAPVDTWRVELDDVALAVVLPYCDGDVLDLAGVHYYDDSRLAAGNPHPKYTFVMEHSNHNYYNTTWSPGTWAQGGALDDFADLAASLFVNDVECSEGPDSTRLSEVEQQATLVALGNAFFRTHLGGEDEYIDVLRGDAEPPAALAPAEPRISAMPPATGGRGLLVNHIGSLDSLATNDLGGAVTADNLTTYDVCGVAPPAGSSLHCVDVVGALFDIPEYDGRQPHVPDLAMARLGFLQPGRWINELGDPKDVSGFAVLQFRAVVDFEDNAYVGGDLDFGVQLVDAAGVEARVSVGDWSRALDEPRGDTHWVLPRLVLGGVRIPLAAFVDAAPALDLGEITRVELVFDTGPGALLLSDLMFADEGEWVVGTTGTETTTGVGEETGAETSSGESSGGTMADDGTSSGGGGAGGGGGGGCGCGNDGGGVTAWWLVVLAARRRDRR